MYFIKTTTFSYYLEVGCIDSLIRYLFGSIGMSFFFYLFDLSFIPVLWLDIVWPLSRKSWICRWESYPWLAILILLPGIFRNMSAGGRGMTTMSTYVYIGSNSYNTIKSNMIPYQNIGSLKIINKNNMKIRNFRSNALARLTLNRLIILENL